MIVRAARTGFSLPLPGLSQEIGFRDEAPTALSGRQRAPSIRWNDGWAGLGPLGTDRDSLKNDRSYLLGKRYQEEGSAGLGVFSPDSRRLVVLTDAELKLVQWPGPVLKELDTLQPHHAGVLEDQFALGMLQVLVQAHARSTLPQNAGQRGLAHFDRFSA